MPSKSLGWAGAIAVLLLVATGCTAVVDGNVRPAPGLTPRPLTGDTVKQVFLDGGELSKLLGQSLKGDPDSPPRFGGREMLFDMNSKPQECNGVVFELQKSPYGSANISKVGRETWWDTGASRAKVISVSEVVVALPKASDADALFTSFSAQWPRCDGVTVNESFPSGERFLTADISDVRSADSVVAATVRSRIVTTIVRARAAGVRANCLVETEVAFFTDHADNTAVDIAHRMMDKVSKLS